MKVAFLTSSHIPKDDRIYYHQAVAIAESGSFAEIISSKSDEQKNEKNISFNCFCDEKLSKKEKIAKFVAVLSNSKPDVIICSEPLTVFAAFRYRKKINKKPKLVYDITEWYPSKKNFDNECLLKKIFKFVALLMFGGLASFYADAFIFGEHYKAKPYRIFFPRKKYIYLGYYPDLSYVDYKEPVLKNDHLRLSYSGKLSHEKGFGNFLDVIEELSSKRKGLSIDVQIVGWYVDKEEQLFFENIIKSLPKNIHVSFSQILPFRAYIRAISSTDIFMDLRTNDFENQHCLPIKLFYFAALKRPVIYTDLKAIRKEVEINKFGFLVQQDDIEKIVDIIVGYIENKALYLKHCSNARMLVEKKYNWAMIKDEFIMFLKALNKD